MLTSVEAEPDSSLAGLVQLGVSLLVAFENAKEGQEESKKLQDNSKGKVSNQGTCPSVESAQRGIYFKLQSLLDGKFKAEKAEKAEKKGKEK